MVLETEIMAAAKPQTVDIKVVLWSARVPSHSGFSTRRKIQSTCGSMDFFLSFGASSTGRAGRAWRIVKMNSGVRAGAGNGVARKTQCVLQTKGTNDGVDLLRPLIGGQDSGLLSSSANLGRLS